MPGSALAVGVVATAAVLAVSLAVVAGAAVSGQRLASAADAAALGAADAASGAATGVPCERADELARVGGADLVECALDGLVATVTVSGVFAGFTTIARARAGPPPDRRAEAE